MTQRPFIAHKGIEYSTDFDVLKIVAPADFKISDCEAPPGYNQGLAIHTRINSQ